MASKYRYFIGVVLTSIAFFCSPYKANASPYIATTFYVPGTCNDFNWRLNDQSMTWDVIGLSGITLNYIHAVNGNIVFSQSDIPHPISGSGSVTFPPGSNWVLWGFGTTMPYDFSYTEQWKSNGQLIAQLTITGRCENGVATASFTNSTPSVTAQNPPLFNDGRIDGRAGDRIAVYCDTASSVLTIYGIDPQGRGLQLAAFNYSDIFEAGVVGVRQEASQGIVSASVDSQNNFWAAWSGGQYGANGLGDFAKGFRCNFSRPVPRPGFNWISQSRYEMLISEYSMRENEWTQALQWQEQVRSFGITSAISVLSECVVRRGLQFSNTTAGYVASAINAGVNFAFGSTVDTESNLALYRSRRVQLQSWAALSGYIFGTDVQVPVDLANDVPLIGFPQFFADWKLLLPISLCFT